MHRTLWLRAVCLAGLGIAVAIPPIPRVRASLPMPLADEKPVGKPGEKPKPAPVTKDADREARDRQEKHQRDIEQKMQEMKEQQQRDAELAQAATDKAQSEKVRAEKERAEQEKKQIDNHEARKRADREAQDRQILAALEALDTMEQQEKQNALQRERLSALRHLENDLRELQLQMDWRTREIQEMQAHAERLQKKRAADSGPDDDQPSVQNKPAPEKSGPPKPSRPGMADAKPPLDGTIPFAFNRFANGQVELRISLAKSLKSNGIYEIPGVGKLQIRSEGMEISPQPEPGPRRSDIDGRLDKLQATVEILANQLQNMELERRERDQRGTGKD